ncbi:hypothetical protein HOLleu_20263 [Holothuria leucospilota]|uniref:Uncharacterized protein n=1 Tax=Holothuria leucospilota TaxID=206669 RepID=A0A9Q1C0H0_HOLLE|nr:hypothetical protein HOLleu_20263 [Holothuria leucospilota]
METEPRFDSSNRSDFDLPTSPSSNRSTPVSCPEDNGHKNNSFSIQNILGEVSPVRTGVEDRKDYDLNNNKEILLPKQSAENLKQRNGDMAAILRPTAIRDAGLPLDNPWMIATSLGQVQPSSPLSPPTVPHAWSPWCTPPFGLPRPLVQGKEHPLIF